MAKHLYHAPSECPVCGDTLITTRKGCLHCGTEIAGEFASCEFCNLNQADLDLLKVFLASRGNLREVEKHLGVSYPTARARFTDLLVKLGLAGEPDAASDGSASDAPASGTREQVLAQVAAGTLAPDQAAALLARL